MIAELLPSCVWTRPPRVWVVAASTLFPREQSRTPPVLTLLWPVVLPQNISLKTLYNVLSTKPVLNKVSLVRAGWWCDFGFISINFPIRVPHSWPRTQRWCKCLTERWRRISGTVRTPACPGDRPSTRAGNCSSTISPLPPAPLSILVQINLNLTSLLFYLS